MPIKLLTELRSMEREFPPVLRRVAEYVIQNAERVVYQTITELGEETSCSLASIQRFYRQLGFTTYGDFKLRLATELASAESRKTVKPRTRLDAVVEDGVEALTQSKELIAQDRLKPAAQKLIQSRRLAVFGIAHSAVVAEYFRLKFMRIGRVSEYTSDPDIAAITLASMSSKDTFVVFSSTGSTLQAVRLTEMAKTLGVWTLGVVNRSKSPITKFLDEQFVVAAPESPLTGGSFSAKISQMLVVEALFQEALKASAQARRIEQTVAEAIVEQTY